MELIFNELSLASPAPDRVTGHRWMRGLSETIRAAVIRGVAPILRTTEDFWSADLAPNYKLAQWSNDPMIDKELKRYVMTIAGKAPFIESLHREAENKSENAVEYSYSGKRALGLGLADLRSYPAISMSAQSWQIPFVEVQVYEVGIGDPKKYVKQVRNWHDASCVRQQESCIWLRQRHGEEIASGAMLLTNRKKYLRQIQFTPTAYNQLEALTGNENAFPQVVQHLLALNFRALDWADGPFQAGYPYPCSEESNATMQKYGSHRDIICSDGIYRRFSWHSKINMETWRIYFIPLLQSRQVLIGHVGSHLPTVSDPH